MGSLFDGLKNSADPLSLFHKSNNSAMENMLDPMNLQGRRQRQAGEGNNNQQSPSKILTGGAVAPAQKRKLYG